MHTNNYNVVKFFAIPVYTIALIFIVHQNVNASIQDIDFKFKSNFSNNKVNFQKNIEVKINMN